MRENGPVIFTGPFLISLSEEFQFTIHQYGKKRLADLLY